MNGFGITPWVTTALRFMDQTILPSDWGGLTYYSDYVELIIEVLAVLSVIWCLIYLLSDKLRPTMTVLMGTFHIFALVGIWKIWTLKDDCLVSRRRIMLDVFILYLVGAMGVTAGAHRLWAHRSYKANVFYRFILMMFNSFANQMSIYNWARDHRLHHKYSEKEPDPHNSMKGFFYAHVGWLLIKRPEIVTEAGSELDMSDLLEDYAVALQEALDPWWNAAFCWIFPSIYGAWVYGSFWLGFFALGCLRWVITLNATWTVNSVAHLWGPRPYNPSIGPVESFVTALVACGEGWHNWHHQYAFDYATAEFGAFRQYNPTKVFIDFFALLGWVWDRKRATRLWELTKSKRAERRRLALEALRDANKTAIENCLPTSTEASMDGSSLDESISSGSIASAYAILPNFPSLVSVENLRSLIPSACYDVSIIKSTAYLLRDIIAVTMVSTVAALLWILVSRMKAASVPMVSSTSASYMFYFCVESSLFLIYSLAQGTVMVGIWLAAYECAGGRFSRWTWLNGVVGQLLSVVVMIPYQSRKSAEGIPKRLKTAPIATAHLCRALYEDVFSIFNVSRLTFISPTASVPLGGVSATVSIGLLIALAKIYSWKSVVCWYFGSWIVMNMWLLLYHHLLLVKVHCVFKVKHKAAFGSSQNEDASGADLLTAEEKLKDVVDKVVEGTQEAEIDNDENEENKEIFNYLNIDPHSIAELQREANEPLTRSTVDYFTCEWLRSAMFLFDRTVLLKNRSEVLPIGDDLSSRGVYVRFVVRLLLFLFGSLHHHLAQINVLQSISLSIPHYNTEEAVRALRAYTRAHQLISEYARGTSKG